MNIRILKRVPQKFNSELLATQEVEKEYPGMSSMVKSPKQRKNLTIRGSGLWCSLDSWQFPNLKETWNNFQCTEDPHMSCHNGKTGIDELTT